MNKKKNFISVKKITEIAKIIINTVIFFEAIQKVFNFILEIIQILYKKLINEKQRI